MATPLSIVTPGAAPTPLPHWGSPTPRGGRRGARVFIVTYRLPVTLTREPSSGAWRAQWVADDITAKTPHSIADDVDTMWVGVVNRECFHPDTLASLLASSPSDGVDGAVAAACTAAPPAAAAEGGGLSGAVAGGLGALAWPAICPEMAAKYGGAIGGKEPTVCGGVPPVEGEAAPAAPAPAPRIAMCPQLSAGDVAGITAALNALRVVPVFLPPLLHEGFASFTLSVLKPALHNVLETGTQRIQPRAASLDFLAAGWRHYSAANAAISAVVLSQHVGEDLVWWHDFWLMSGPHCLARAVVDRAARAPGAPAPDRPAQVFYMHAPFPTSEVFRTIPVR